MLELKTVAIRPTGTYSVALWGGMPFAVTLEPYPAIIKNGGYTCTRDFYHHGGYPTYQIHVEGHDRVLFHKGNFVGDTKACVLMGESFAVLGGKEAIADSKHGFEEFMQLTAGVPQFILVVSGRG